MIPCFHAHLPANAIDMARRIGPVTAAIGTGQVRQAYVYRNDLVNPRGTGGLSVLAAELDLLSTVGGNVASGQWLNNATERYPSAVLGSDAARQPRDRQPAVRR